MAGPSYTAYISKKPQFSENQTLIFRVKVFSDKRTYRDIEFAEEMVEKENPSLAEKLYITLDGKGAFRRFKQVLEKDTE